MQILYDLVTVTGENCHTMPLRKREGLAVCRPGSQETCRSLVQGESRGYEGLAVLHEAP